MPAQPTFDATLLEYLVCPETHQRLALASAAQLDMLRGRQRVGQLRNREGQPVSDAFEVALVREDGVYAYLVSEGIPNMLIEEAVPLAAD